MTFLFSYLHNARYITLQLLDISFIGNTQKLK
jgi:hypothetical protein